MSHITLLLCRKGISRLEQVFSRSVLFQLHQLASQSEQDGVLPLHSLFSLSQSARITLHTEYWMDGVFVMAACSKVLWELQGRGHCRVEIHKWHLPLHTDGIKEPVPGWIAKHPQCKGFDVTLIPQFSCNVIIFIYLISLKITCFW